MGFGVGRMSRSENRALVVDDDDIARETIARLLKSMGCEVVVASGAEEATACFLNAKFDLVTLDYRMPGLDGAALHKILSQEFGSGKRTTARILKKLPPIVIITAYPEDPDVLRTQFGEGIVGVVQKPHIRDSLQSIVYELMGTPPPWTGNPSAPPC